MTREEYELGLLKTAFRVNLLQYTNFSPKEIDDMLTYIHHEAIQRFTNDSRKN
jgi:hypothetical protein